MFWPMQKMFDIFDHNFNNDNGEIQKELQKPEFDNVLWILILNPDSKKTFYNYFELSTHDRGGLPNK